MSNLAKVKNRNHHYIDGLSSKRLKTSFIESSDSRNWKDFLADPEATKHLLPIELSPSAWASHWVKSQLDRYKSQRYGLQSLRLKESNEYIGQCGLLTQEVDGKTELEVGYHILRRHWGKGYAPEAAKLFIDFAFEHELANSVISIIHKENLQSRQVALKNGLRFEKELVFKGIEVHIYRIHFEKK